MMQNWFTLALASIVLAVSAGATPLTGQATVYLQGGFVDSAPISGDLDVGANSMTIEPFQFLGFTASSTIELLGEGTYTRDNGFGGTITTTVEAGQVGAYVVIQWGPNTIPTFMVWNVGGVVYTTTDSDGDGWPGHTIQTLPFPNLSVVYDFVVATPGPGIKVSITVDGGDVQECATTGGSVVSMTANVDLLGGAALGSLEWFVDGDPAGNSETIEPFLSLGDHTVQVVAETIDDLVATDSVHPRVKDDRVPHLDVAFVDSRSGEAITHIDRANVQWVITSFPATDVCDPEPVVDGMVSFPMNDGDLLKIQGNNDTVLLTTSEIQAHATVRDASGNWTARTATLILE
jgi:hypothetical protein